MVSPVDLFESGVKILGVLLFCTGSLCAQNTPVINEIQTGGISLSGDEFIELYNSGPCAYDLNGHRVVYRTTAGTSDAFTFVAFTTTSFVPPKGFVLIVGPQYTGAVSGDISYSPAALAAAGGGVAIRKGPIDTGTVLDSVGYGTLTTNAFVETAPAPAPPPGNSIERTPRGVDTNNNSTDFVVTTATPEHGGVNAGFALNMSGKRIFYRLGKPFTFTVASFTDSYPGAVAGQFSATINWGDGASSVGVTRANQNGGFDVIGTHAYTKLGGWQMVVNLSDCPGGGSATVTNTARLWPRPASH